MKKDKNFNFSCISLHPYVPKICIYGTWRTGRRRTLYVM